MRRIIKIVTEITFSLLALPAAGTATASPMTLQAPDSAGIDFRHLTVAQACSIAGATGRQVFIDCYTKSCGPCKYMAANVFTQPQVGEFFNPRYVSLKMDMEEGEGQLTASRYGVRIYPTLLVLEPSGELYMKMEGGAVKTAPRFMSKFLSHIQLASMDYRFAQGERAHTFLTAYLDSLASLGSVSRQQQMLSQLYEGRPLDYIAAPAQLTMVSRYMSRAGTPLFDRLYHGRDTVGALIGPGEARRLLADAMGRELEAMFMMPMDFGSRLALLDTLAAEGCTQASVTATRMLMRQIINNSERGRVASLVKSVNALADGGVAACTCNGHPDALAQVQLLRTLQYLQGVERVASASQRVQLAEAMTRATQALEPDQAEALGPIIARLRQM